jgi:ribosomal protein S18 acetylase RimI-like enzyme
MPVIRLSRPDPAFDDLFRIYTQAHPASERKSLEALRDMISRPEYLFLAAVDPDTVIGFAIAIAFADSDAALLEYVAVDAAHRGRGIGQLLFRAVADHPQIRDRFLLVEVDSDRMPSPDASDPARRKRFYSRQGCKQIEGLAYQMPRVSTAEPPLMDLLVHRHELPHAIQKSHLRSWLEACYMQVYQQSIPDPRIASMLESLPDRIALSEPAGNQM